MRLEILLALALLAGVSPLPSQPAARDYDKSHSIPPFGQIFISNTSGTIRVSACEAKEVHVTATINGPDREFLRIQDNSTPGRIEIFPRYLQFGKGNASVDIEVRIPQGVDYHLNVSSFSGRVEVDGVRGRIIAKSHHGDVSMKKVQGFAMASSVSGRVGGELERTKERNNVLFTSISGSIAVEAPGDLNAMVDLSSHSGGIHTDFPVEIKDMRYGPGKLAKGKLGAGGQIVSIRSTYGRVSLTRQKPVPAPK
ncbi:MAG: DUF4097 family beta strand repeat protein [Acidobacteria bacterium]|nr:DUF4097 family beta strand repeat protein [Acidobacteriota bacterium]